MYVRPRARFRPRNAGGAPFSPASLFTGGVQGAWYDPSDYSTLFQDSAGTTPVTAVEQPVGLMLDKSQGLVLGSELVTNGGPGFTTTTGWTTSNATVAASGGKLVCTKTGAGGAVYWTLTTVVGTWYKVDIVWENVDATAPSILVNSSGGLSITTTNTTATVYFIAAATTTFVQMQTGSGAIGTSTRIISLSTKTISGNHASQATAASRPVLRARYNLLTYSEQFDNAAWTKDGGASATANTAVAPDGTTTADTLTDSAVSGQQRAYQTITVPSGAQVTFSVCLKQGTRRYARVTLSNSDDALVVADLQAGTIAAGTNTTTWSIASSSITALGDGWYRVSITASKAATTTYYPIVALCNVATVSANGYSYTGNGSTIYIWGADLRTGSSAGTYQRIAAATDYATTGFLPYLDADGVDDSMSIPSAVLTGATSATEMHSAWRPAGNVTGNGSVFANFGTDTISDHEPYQDSTLYSGFASTSRQTFATLAAIENPYILEQVQTGTTLAAYRNGTQLSTTKTVNFALGSAPKLFFSSAGSGFGYRGRFFGGITISKVLSASETTSLRNYLAAKSGVTL